MSNDNAEKKQPARSTPPTVDGFDGFTDEVEGVDADGQGAPGGVIQGHMIKYTNEATWELRGGEGVPPSLELIVVDVLRIYQKWIDQQPVETRVLAPGERVPDIEALNEAAPKTEWSKDFNGNSRGPWQFQYIVYLLDTDTMDKYTFPTGTVGGGIAVRELADKVKWMRRIRGDKVCAVVTLSNIFMNTRFGGRQRPHFVVKRWVHLQGPTPSPTGGDDKLGAMAEYMNDELPPCNDSPDINEPPPAPKPQVNKRGVQKLAGGRR